MVLSEGNHTTSDLLFRGHGSACWKLDTTLERYKKYKNCLKGKYSEREYHDFIQTLEPYVHSLTSHRFKAGDYERDGNDIGPPPSYEFMIYLRHHGFPSPLLDWSESPYVAAYFAFEAAKDNCSVAIYSFREYGKNGKSSEPAKPTIRGYGSTVITHQRHYQQQCQYTVCYSMNRSNGERIYCSHEKAHFSDNQDVLTKYILPSNQRTRVLRRLDMMNVNAFTLFGNEEGLVKMLAFRFMEHNTL